MPVFAIMVKKPVIKTDTFHFNEAVAPKSVNDNFTGTNGDPPNTDRWTVAATNFLFRIQSNTLYSTLDRDGGTTVSRLESNWRFAGGTDFSMFIDLPTFSYSPSAEYYRAFLTLRAEDGDIITIGRNYEGAADWWRAYSYISGSSVGRGNIAPDANHASGKLWLRRNDEIGNAWWEVWLYNDNTTTWDRYARYMWNSTAAFRIRIESRTGSVGDNFTTAWDNFSVASGTILWDNPDWVNPANAFDGSLSTYARTNGYPSNPDTFYVDNDTNTCNGTDLGVISKVELRVNGYNADGTNVGDFNITPIIDGTTSTTTTITGLDSTAGYSDNIDITDFAGAPITWTWPDIQSLDVDITGTIDPPGDDAGDVIYMSMVQILVTYTET